MKAGMSLVAAVVFCFSPLGAAQQTIDYSKGVDFSQYKSYNWTKGVPAKNPTIETSIRDAIDTELKGKGFTRSSDDPDLHIASYASAKEEKLENWPSLMQPITVDRVGSLVVDLTDARSGRIVWRGVAHKILAAKTQHIAKQVDKAVKKLFRKFPPKQKE